MLAHFLGCWCGKIEHNRENIRLHTEGCVLGRQYQPNAVSTEHVPLQPVRVQRCVFRSVSSGGVVHTLGAHQDGTFVRVRELEHVTTGLSNGARDGTKERQAGKQDSPARRRIPTTTTCPHLTRRTNTPNTGNEYRRIARKQPSSKPVMRARVPSPLRLFPSSQLSPGFSTPSPQLFSVVGGNRKRGLRKLR